MSVNREKIYSPEFRESSAKLAIESRNTIAHTARDLGVKISTLHTWISKYSRNKSPNIMNDEKLHEELKRLKKEIAQVTMERDILKKAAAYFAKQAL